MGAGIAISFLFAGFRVTLVDAKQVGARKGSGGSVESQYRNAVLFSSVFFLYIY